MEERGLLSLIFAAGVLTTIGIFKGKRITQNTRLFLAKKTEWAEDIFAKLKPKKKRRK